MPTARSWRSSTRPGGTTALASEAASQLAGDRQATSVGGQGSPRRSATGSVAPRRPAAWRWPWRRASGVDRRPLPGADLAERHVRHSATGGCSNIASSGAGILRIGAAARAARSAVFLRAGRDDGRAGAPRRARSVRVPKTQHLAPALARGAQGRRGRREVDAARRRLERLGRENRRRPRDRRWARTT